MRRPFHRGSGRVAIALLALAAGLPAAPQEWPNGIRVQINVPVPMRDGVRLSADVYRPEAAGKYPCLLMRTYWGKHEPGKISSALEFAKNGYAVVLQDVRGRFDSGGQWTPYVNEVRDGYDSQMWLGQQEWCNGKVGTFGESYDGFTQLMPAPLHCPYVKCLVPFACQQTNFGHLYNEGVLQIGTAFTAGLFMVGHTLQPTIGGVYGSGLRLIEWDAFLRRVPLISALDEIADVPWVKDWIRHDQYDSYWDAYGLKGKYQKIDAPAYFVTGWYDNLVHETWKNFQGFRQQAASGAARQGSKIIVGPWVHGATAPDKRWPIAFGPQSAVNLNDLHLKWYDHWLKNVDNGIDRQAPIQIFVMGANQWRSEKEWPLPGTQWTDFYLNSGGKANGQKGDGTLAQNMPPKEGSPTDEFVYDPRDPVPTAGGQIAIFPEMWGARDRRAVQERADVLVYSTPPLPHDLEVTGPVEVIVYAASSAPDTDFTATLSDVHPDGKAIHLCEGIRGARFRASLEHPTAIDPGRIYEYRISLWETSIVFLSGHRIRLEISSSNFPRFARNQNTAKPFGTSSEMNIARQRVFHESGHASRLVLPVVVRQ